MATLVTGGAGYIGSAVVEDLRRSGEAVSVIDNLDYGHREALHDSVPFYKGDIGDTALVDEILETHGIDAVMHFSAYAYVGESVSEPGKYFENNVAQTISLLNSISRHGIRKFVFSSTCSVYGEPDSIPINESHPKRPTNPYGLTKLMVEQILGSFDAAFGMRSISLRYFNAAGATEEHGEHHDPETHLIPLVLSAASGTRPSVSIFGNDYPTDDGTAVRDYIHISDISRAHILALSALDSGMGSDAFNLGNGSGFSVMEVIEAARKVTGREITAEITARRPGDPSVLIADAQKARKQLGWEPEFVSIDEIIESAWKWLLKNPEGYSK